MSTVPKLTAKEVESLIPDCKVIGPSRNGNQKLFFPVNIKGEDFSAKFLLANPEGIREYDDQQIEEIKETILTRAKREVDAIIKCDSPYLVGIGPIEACCLELNEQTIFYYTEELIDGEDLQEVISRKYVPSISEVVKLAIHMASAISSLSKNNKVHRDVKPANIMRRNGSGDFVLLDLGIVFDAGDKSLTAQHHFVPGTMPYFSPEHTDFKQRRDMDFRSDLFCLGVVLYEFSTGVHPFWTSRRMTENELITKILEEDPIAPGDLRKDLPAELSYIVMRLLEKQPHSRFRKISDLLSRLAEMEVR